MGEEETFCCGAICLFQKKRASLTKGLVYVLGKGMRLYHQHHIPSELYVPKRKQKWKI